MPKATTPSTISTSSEDLEQARILGASTLKVIVSTSVGCEQVSSSESGGGDEERDTNGPKHWSIAHRDELNQQLASRVTCSFVKAKG